MGRKRSTRGVPRRKRMRREQRLEAARTWLTTYEGRHIVRGYQKHFGVDFRCAVLELRLLGVVIDQDYVDRVLSSLEDLHRQRQQRKLAAQAADENSYEQDQDPDFYYIAGYTSGGVPYGVTWDDARADAGAGPEANADSLDFIPSPDQCDIHEWSIMRDFARSRCNDEQREMLLDAVHGTGAFRRFKDTVRTLDIDNDWYAFRDQALETIAREFLEKHNIPYTNETATDPDDIPF